MLEVCVDTLHAARKAQEAGAERIELCSALEIGGVTPCGSLISAVRSAVSIPLIVLIRPRGGDFFYDASETEQSIDAVTDAVERGADGVAVGGLTPDGTLDLQLLGRQRERLGNKQLVMHRAFDEILDPSAALEELIALGFTRVLTSGGAISARAGVQFLRQFQYQSRGRITVMPGGGITVKNAAMILKISGCSELHGSFRTVSPIRPSETWRPNAVWGERHSVDTAAIAEVRSILDSLSDRVDPRANPRAD